MEADGVGPFRRFKAKKKKDISKNKPNVELVYKKYLYRLEK